VWKSTTAKRDNVAIDMSQSTVQKTIGLGQRDNVWSEYRKRRNLALFAFIGYIPAVALVAFVCIVSAISFSPAFVAAFLWAVFFVVAANLTMRFQCPRCGKPFFAKWWYHNVFARKCLHCGLRKYADPDLIAEQS
jgi:hypothetical protein